jgi:hypothetical protein
MAEKYLKVGTTGNLEEVEATVQSSGAADAGKIVALGSDGKLDDTVMPEGIGAEVIVVQAGEDLAANDVVNIYDDAGTLKARKADATDATKPAVGYVKEAATAGSNVSVYTDGFLPGSGFTTGSKYFLATTPGQVTTTPPGGSGNIVQYIGRAISTDKIKFEPDTFLIVRA